MPYIISNAVLSITVVVLSYNLYKSRMAHHRLRTKYADLVSKTDLLTERMERLEEKMFKLPPAPTDDTRMCPECMMPQDKDDFEPGDYICRYCRIERT